MLEEVIDDLIMSLKSNVEALFKKYQAVIDLLNDLGVIVTRNIDQNLFPELATQVQNGRVVAIRNNTPIFSGTDEAFGAFAKKIDEINDSAGGGKKGKAAVDEYLDEIEDAFNWKKVPPSSEFTRWFDEIPYEEFMKLWLNKSTRLRIEYRIRKPGALHEWFCVARADTFKSWGISMRLIKDARTKITDINFINPIGKHNGFNATRTHNQLLKLIDESTDKDDYLVKLNLWAKTRLKNGIEDLPKMIQL